MASSKESSSHAMAFKKLQGASNYREWSRKMQMALEDALLWDFVTGTILEPKTYSSSLAPDKWTDDTHDRYEARADKIKLWKQKERQTTAKIQMMCSDTIAKDFLALKKDWKPPELWKHLQSRYTLQNWASKWNVIKQLLETTHKEKQHVADYTSRIREILGEMVDMKISISDLVVIHTINNLSSVFDNFVSIIAADAREKETLPSFEKLAKDLEDEEIRVSDLDKKKGTANAVAKNPNKGKAPQNQTESQAPNSPRPGNNKKKDYMCPRCGKKHNKPSDCWMSKETCKKCGKPGHIDRFCFTDPAISGPATTTGNQTSNDTASKGSNKGLSCCFSKVSSDQEVGQQIALASVKVEARHVRDPPTSVIIDSGATDHFFANRAFFTSYREYYHEFRTGSGEIVPAYGVGNVHLEALQLDGSINNINVKEVSYAPDLGHNLLSTIPLSRKGVEVWLRDEKHPSQIIYEGEVHAFADIINNQYVIRISPPDVETAIINTASTATSAETWHARLGHLGYRNLMRLPQMATGIEVKGPIPSDVCGDCMKGRQQRRPSRIPMTRSTKVLDEVHSDLGGPFPPSRHGLRYYESFLDDASGAMWIYPMRAKSQAFEMFLEFITWAERQTGSKLKVYHTDGGGEFDNNQFQDYHKKHGVKWAPSAPYTPEQNGKAERLNYTVMSAVRAILHSMQLPKSLWVEIIKAVAYLRNRSPGVDGITPYEKLHNSKPDLAHLRVLGSRAWVHIPKEKRTKLEKRSWQGIHVGYGETNQYRIYDPTTGVVHVTRDVVIDEHKLYDRSGVPDYELFDEDWKPSDDAEFADPFEHDNGPIYPPDPPSFPSRSIHQPANVYLPTPRVTPTPAQHPPPPVLPQSVGGPVQGPVGGLPGGWDDDDDYIGNNGGEDGNGNGTGQGGQNQQQGPGNSSGNQQSHQNHQNQQNINQPANSAGLNPIGTSAEVPQPQQQNQPRRSGRERKAPQRYPGDQTYLVYDQHVDAAINRGWELSNQQQLFSSTRAAKSHTHMVNVLQTLTANAENEGPDEPRSLKEAMKRSDWHLWHAAMIREFESLRKNKTWVLEHPPHGRRVITGRWVFRLKKDRFGHIQKYKARWVVHGFKQQEGLDYVDTFAAVVKPMSYKCLMAMSVKRGYKIHHMDVVTAFLYGFLDEVIYVEQPHMFNEDPDKVCRLIKALYGLKQAPQVWYQNITTFLKKLGFDRMELDHGVFVSKDGVVIAIYVDDLLIFGTDEGGGLDAIKNALKSTYEMTDLGEISHYLGMEIDHSVGDKITLTQKVYIRKILTRFGMEGCKTASIPIDLGVANSLFPFAGQADHATTVWYQSVTGSIMWPAVHTRPDIAYAVGVLSRYCGNPGPIHCKLITQVLRYLAGTIDVGITFIADSPDELIGYSDSDWAGLIDGRKSTGGYVFILAGAPISHQSKQQAVVALSSTEAEYMAITEAGKEALWVSRFLSMLGFRKEGPVDLRVDNKGAIVLTENPEFHRRTKHIDLRHHWIREKVESKEISITYISTKEMVADGLTKALAPAMFNAFRTMLGMGP